MSSRPMPAELFATLHEAIAHLATHDPEHRRFGARHHRYRAGAPLAADRLAAIEAELEVRLPDDYREHLLEIGDGGAGPYYGLMPLDHPLQLAAGRGTFPSIGRVTTAAAPPGRALYQGVIGLAHLGCGYIAFLVVRGPARGQIWLDARTSGDGVLPTHACFRDFYLEWVEAVANARWQRGFVTHGRCALPSALTAYLHGVEDRLGVAHGGLPLDTLRAALGEIGSGGIATADGGDSPYFASGDLVDLCSVCEQTVENLLPRGLRRDQLEPGLSPIPMRDRWP